MILCFQPADHVEITGTLPPLSHMPSRSESVCAEFRRYEAVPPPPDKRTRFFLTGRRIIGYIGREKLVPARSGVCGVSSSSGYTSLRFPVEEDFMEVKRGTRFQAAAFCLAVQIYTLQPIAHIAFLEEGGIVKSYTVIVGKDGGASLKCIVGCFGMWPEHEFQLR